jgi:hypothetical protein
MGGSRSKLSGKDFKDNYISFNPNGGLFTYLDSDPDINKLIQRYIFAHVNYVYCEVRVPEDACVTKITGSESIYKSDKPLITVAKYPIVSLKLWQNDSAETFHTVANSCGLINCVPEGLRSELIYKKPSLYNNLTDPTHSDKMAAADVYDDFLDKCDDHSFELCRTAILGGPRRVSKIRKECVIIDDMARKNGIETVDQFMAYMHNMSTNIINVLKRHRRYKRPSMYIPVSS